MASIGARIKEERHKEGLTQTELAEKLHCSINTVSRWENDKHIPSVEELKKISEVLDVSFVDEVFQNESDKLNFNQELVSILEEIRLDLARNKKEKIKKSRFVFIVVTILLLVVILLFGYLVYLFFNYPAPNSNQPMIIEYLNKEDVE